MKVAITGTHSTGKTTLARRCAASIGVPFVQGDRIAQIMDRYFPGKHLEDLTSADFWFLEKKGLRERISAESRHEQFVSDGCTLNSIAYALAECGEEIRKRHDFSEFKRIALSNTKTYSHIIYLPPEITLEDDGLRPRSQTFRQKVDEIICDLLQGFKFFTVNGSVKQRVEQVRKIVGYG